MTDWSNIRPINDAARQALVRLNSPQLPEQENTHLQAGTQLPIVPETVQQIQDFKYKAMEAIGGLIQMCGDPDPAICQLASWALTDVIKLTQR